MMNMYIYMHKTNMDTQMMVFGKGGSLRLWNMAMFGC